MNARSLRELTDQAVDEKILAIKRTMGERLFIPVHHYQRDEIVAFGDGTGDSLELSRLSASTRASHIVFCGVYFMAEIARVLASGDKHVFIPNRSAGCPLADLAPRDEVERLWRVIEERQPGVYVPVTYANSHVEIKALCGRNGGYVCTSSNAQRVFRAVLDSGRRVFFTPDRNLGLNTAFSMGMGAGAAVVNRYSFERPESIPDVPLLVWDGFCIVHKRFTLEQVRAWRRRDPGCRIVVHPECDPEVVGSSDYSGSTSKIKKMVEESPQGSRWVVGTELNMVRRLKALNPGKSIEPLDSQVCLNMAKNTRRDLLAALLAVREGDNSTEVLVPAGTAADAREAVERMLALG
jgi:quinolinate synthase